MQLLFILIFVASSLALESSSKVYNQLSGDLKELVGTDLSLVSPVQNHQTDTFDMTNAVASLTPNNSILIGDFGEGILTNYLETVAENALSRQWIYRIVSSLGGDVQSTSAEKRAEFKLNVKAKSFKVTVKF